MNLPLQDKISALFLCADILDYPDEDFQNKIQKLEQLTKIEQLNDEVSLEEIQAEHIRVFIVSSKLLKTTPYASMWIDGKMFGKSLDKINDFYAKCGYVFDAESMKKPADNLSFMITFVAILAEENRFEELVEFYTFLNWMTDFSKSLSEATTYKSFKVATDVTIQIINSFKENR